MENFSLDFLLNPTLDIAKFNTLISSIKAGFDNLKPIDASILASSLSKVKPTIVGLVQGTDVLATGIGKAVTETTKLSKAGSLAASAFNFSNMMNSVNIISSAFGTVAQAGIDYESNLAAVSAITGFTGDKLDVLGASARGLAKDFGGSANDQLKSFQGILSKLGPEMAEDAGALELMAKNVNTLSAASGDDAATSMNAIADAMLQMGLASGTSMEQAQNSTKVINAYAAGAKVGAAEIPQVAQSLLAAGVAAKGANMSLVDVNAAIQVLAVGGKTGAEAGTALRNVLSLMQKASGPAEAAMAKLGTSSKELGSLLTTQGLDVALAKLNDGMNKVGTDAEKNALMMEIFGTENAAAAGIMMQNTDKFAEFSQGIEEGMQGQGSAFEQAGIRMNTASSIISRIQANISDAFIGITQSVGQGVTALIGASTQIAPLMMSFSGISQILPEGTFTNAMSSIKTFSTTIVSQLVPGLISQDIATQSVVFNTEALTLANIKQSIATKAKVALDYLQSTAIWQVVSGQTALNAAMLANPIGATIVGIGLLVGGLYLLYNNVESVRNVFDNAWQVIKFGASQAWEVIKSFGSVLYEIGATVVNVIATPFKVVWGVVSTVGEKIASLFGVTQGFGTDLSSIFTGIQSLASGVINVFNQVSAVIAGVSGVVGSMTESISTGIGQLLTLDFGGLYDTVTGAGDKAGAEFNNAFNAKMRTANFDEAKRNIETGLTVGEGINVKIKAQTDFQATIKAYEDAQNEMNALASKKANGGLTDEEGKKFEELKKKASEYGAKIQNIAPEAVKGFSAIVGANGEITNSYDINIEKAKEFGKANDYSKALENQKNAVSKNVSAMANTYTQQKDVVKNLQAELAKPVTDEKAYAKLRESFASATKQSAEMGQQLVDNFYKAGEAGMLTDDAITKVAKSMGKTNAEAKDMLLSKELKSAGEAGVLTAKQTDALVQKYGVSKEKVTEIFNKQKQITAETLKTQQATEDWSGALDRIKKDQAKALDAVKTAQLQYKKGQITKEDLDLITKASEEKIKAGNAEVKTVNEVSKEIAKNKNLRIDEIKDVKDYTKENAKANKEAKSAYEIEKEKFQLQEKEFANKQTDYEQTLKKERIEKGITVSSMMATNDKIDANNKELEFLDTKLVSLDKQMKLADTIVDKDKKAQAEKRQKAKDDAKADIEAVETKIKTLKNNNTEFQIQITADDKKLKEEIETLNSDKKRLEIEAKVKLGLADATELDNYDLSQIFVNKEKALKDIAEIQQKILNNQSNGADTKQLEADLAKQQNTVVKYTNEIAIKQTELFEKQERNRISLIADSAERERSLKLFELTKTYNEEMKLANGNTAKMLSIQLAYQDQRNKAEQDFLTKTSLAYNAVSKLSSAFSNIKAPTIDNSKLIDLNKTKSSIANERKELQNSYNNSKIDYEAYQKSLTDLQQKESDNRIAIEKAESEKRRMIWSGLTGALNGYFTDMYSTYSAKATEAQDKIKLTHQNSFEIKKQIIIKEKALEQAKNDGDSEKAYRLTQEKIALQNQLTANTETATKTETELYSALGVATGAMFGQMITDHKNWGKSAIDVGFTVLKSVVAYAIAKIWAEEIAEKSFGGLVTAPVLTAVVTGALSVAQSSISGSFKDGVINFRGKGTGTSDDNHVLISNGESVITARGTQRNKNFLEHINKGGDLFSYIKNNPSIQSELARKKIAENYDNVLLQQAMFESIVENDRQNIRKLESQNKELVSEIRDLKNVLVETLKSTTLVETKHAFNINATNNVINQVEKADLWRR